MSYEQRQKRIDKLRRAVEASPAAMTKQPVLRELLDVMESLNNELRSVSSDIREALDPHRHYY